MLFYPLLDKKHPSAGYESYPKDIYSSYHRSAGQTVKMSKDQVKALIATSQGITFEKQVAKDNLTKDDILKYLNYKALYRILDKNIPQSIDAVIDRLADLPFV